MKRLTAAVLLVLLTTPAFASALAGDKAAYVGGTIARFNIPSTRIEGRVEIHARHFVFVPENGPHAAEALRIGYESSLRPQSSVPSASCRCRQRAVRITSR
jgi:hypothetical protein